MDIQHARDGSGPPILYGVMTNTGVKIATNDLERIL
jgi:hypothetical protein